MQLADFGVSRIISDTASTFCGTPLYMSPEMLTGEPYSVQADVYALGCMVYFLCTGRHAFSARSLEGVKV